MDDNPLRVFASDSLPNPRALGVITDIQEPSDYARHFRDEAAKIRTQRDSWLHLARARQGSE